MNFRSIVTLLAASALSTVGCLSARSFGLDDEGDGPLGRFDLRSEMLGTTELLPGACTSGERQMFLGFDLSDGARRKTVRLVVDPLGEPAVRVFDAEAPFGKSHVFRRGDCKTFSFSLHPTGWKINHVRDYRVSLTLDCGAPEAAVAGNASATHCH